MNLEECRKQINKIDSEILELLKERMLYCWEIGVYKKENNLPIRNEQREQELIDKLSIDEQWNGMVKAIWPAIFEYSRSMQDKID